MTNSCLTFVKRERDNPLCAKFEVNVVTVVFVATGVSPVNDACGTHWNQTCGTHVTTYLALFCLFFTSI